MKNTKDSITSQEEISLSENEAFALPLSELAKQFKTNLETGLSQRDAEERFRRVGQNIIPRVKINLLRIYLEPLSNWLVVSYIIASTVLAFIAFLFLPELWFNLSIWLPLIAINIAIIIIQTARAQNELTGIQHLLAPKSWVLREKKLVEILSEELVPGDIIRLKQGDMIPADCRIIEFSNLRVNEASLTGESGEVEKSRETPADLEETMILRKRSSLFLGTFVVSGTASALIVKTGGDTQIGRMASALKKLNVPKISLRRNINKLVKRLAFIILLYLCISIIYNVVVFHLSGNLPSSLLTLELAKSLIKAIGILPLNLPLLVTVIMLSGAMSMAQHNVIVRDLNVVEKLSRLPVVCIDKTGTITQNKMTVKWVCLAISKGRDKLYYVTQQNSASEGKIFAIRRYEDLENVIENPKRYVYKNPVNMAQEVRLRYLLTTAFLSNDGNLIGSKDGKKAVSEAQASPYVASDATDAALLSLFNKTNIDLAAYDFKFQTILSLPLDGESKLITKILKDNTTDKYLLLTKGATETLLAESQYVLSEEGKAQILRQRDRTEIAKKIEVFSQYGKRVVSFAFREMDSFDPMIQRESIENNLTYLGYAAIADPSRKGVYSAVSKLKNAGIKPVMITGDSLAVAQSIAEEVGIKDSDQQHVEEGSQIKALSDHDFLNTVAFARVSPEDKSAIVTRYKGQNQLVAMIGDGVNDAQAILAADVGIAMGLTGTDVAKETADVVLADDSLNSIVKGIEEGRGAFEKIQNIVFFLIAVSIGEALVLFGSSFTQGFFLLNTWQLIYIAVCQFVSPFALVIDRLRQDIMKEKPRNNEDFIGEKRRISFIVFTLSLTVVLSIAYVLAFNGILPVFDANKAGYIPDLKVVDPFNSFNWEQTKARTMLLSVVILTTSALVLSLRRIKKPILESLRQDRNPRIWPFVLSVPLFHVILMYVPAIQYFLSGFGITLEIIQLAPIDWLVVLVLGFIPIAMLELTKMQTGRVRKDYLARLKKRLTKLYFLDKGSSWLAS